MKLFIIKDFLNFFSSSTAAFARAKKSAYIYFFSAFFKCFVGAVCYLSFSDIHALIVSLIYNRGHIKNKNVSVDYVMITVKLYFKFELY